MPVAAGQEPPEVTVPDPELADGADVLLRPLPELPVLDELDVAEPEPDELDVAGLEPEPDDDWRVEATAV